MATYCFFPFDPNHFAPTDVRNENTQLVMRLGTSISLETMKQALENKDKDLAMAQKEARTKTKLADEKLGSVGKLEDEIKDLKAIISVSTQEKAKLEEKLT